MNILMVRAWEILYKNRRAYLVLSGLYYGTLLVLMIYAIFDAPLQSRMLEVNHGAYMTGALALGEKTALDMEVLQVLGRALIYNVLGTSYTNISLPSFFIPFIGVFLGLYRAAMLGIGFSPLNAEISQIIIPHIPTMFLEGQATILAMLGATIQGMAMIRPASIGQTSRWKAYVEGVRQTGTLYMFIMPILLVSAVYGVFETALFIW